MLCSSWRTSKTWKRSRHSTRKGSRACKTRHARMKLRVYAVSLLNLLFPPNTLLPCTRVPFLVQGCADESITSGSLQPHGELIRDAGIGWYGSGMLLTGVELRAYRSTVPVDNRSAILPTTIDPLADAAVLMAAVAFVLNLHGPSGVGSTGHCRRAAP